MHGHSRAVAFDFADVGGDVRTRVGLVEDYCRLCTAGPDSGQVPFDSAYVEVPVQAADDEHDVDVGGDHLGARLATRRTSDEHGAPGKHAVDDGSVPRTWSMREAYPVTSARKPILLQLNAEPSSEPRLPRTHAGPDFISASMLGGDPGRDHLL